MTEQKTKFLIPEAVYDHDHPEVIFWTKFFMDQAKTKNVFTNINAAITSIEDRHQAAHVVAAAWYDFACYVPTFITKAVTQTDDPEWQHHMIQIAYDELGGRYKNNIHSKLFLEATRSIGISFVRHERDCGINPVLKILDRTLTTTSSHYGIIGLLLSFEIIAEENIETLFRALCATSQDEETLAKSKFFRIHRADETEHIRHSIANFLKFCKTDQHRAEFKVSFDAGIDYWQRFWDQMARMMLVDCNQRRMAVAL